MVGGRTLPRWVTLAARWQVAVVAVVLAVPAAIAASFVPYRHWDAMAFGFWSKRIAATGDLFPGELTAGMVHRPLFYVAQGLGWRWLDDGEWVGRWLSLLFTAAFVAAVWWLAGRLAEGRPAAALLRPLAASAALASSAIALYAIAGLSDVPVAATGALTAVAVLSSARDRVRLPLVVLAATATVLAKPSGFVALAGVALGAAVLLAPPGRRLWGALTALGAGAAVGLAYNLVQADRLGISLRDELSSGNTGYFAERAAAARSEAVLRVEWLGAGVRPLVLAGLVFSVARALGAGPRTALLVAGPTALAVSVLGPLAAGDGTPYPFAEPSWLGLACWLGLAALPVGAAPLARDDALARRTHVALLAWALPGAAAWVGIRSDEVRFLAPAWAPLLLMAAATLTCAALALARARTWLALAPAVLVTAMVVANVPSIDGLGRGGWRELAEGGPSAWTDPGAMENFAYGVFADELSLIRATAGDGGRIVSSDARLPYFFPGRTGIHYPVSCAELAGARVFVLLLGDESVAFMRRAGGPPDPLSWEQCASPRLYPVGSHDGIYAVYAVGAPPARPPTPDDCRVTTTPGELLDGVFLDGAAYAEAKALRARAAAVGYQAARIERTGCGTYRVVVTGIPLPQENQDDFLRESSGAGFDVEIREPVRYPEVPADVPPASR